MKIYDLKTPALILDYDILENNIKRMQKKAFVNKVNLRPHIKTHKCIEIAKLQRDYGAIGITASTIDEVIHFANADFNDITWAFPFHPCYLDKTFELMKKINLGILIDSINALEYIEQKSKHSGVKANIWLEIDCGQHRSGVDMNSESAKSIAKRLQDSKYINFIGLLTHAGHSYQAKNFEEIKRIAQQEQDIILKCKNFLLENTNIKTSIGSTPTISASEKINNIDEIRPGNYVFYDYTQVLLGSCNVKDCALSILSTVISLNKSLNYLVTDAGGLTLSKDTGPTQINNYRSYGMIYKDLTSNELIESLVITNLTQEHSIITDKNAEPIVDKFKYGDKIKILMNHSCLVSPLFDYFYVCKGEEIIDKWEIKRKRNLTN